MSFFSRFIFGLLFNGKPLKCLWGLNCDRTYHWGFGHDSRPRICLLPIPDAKIYTFILFRVDPINQVVLGSDPGFWRAP
jgi:hypothetical protein